MDKIYLPENIAARGSALSSQSYPVVLATDKTFSLDRISQPIPPEVVEISQFGFPLQDERVVLFADTNAYGIDLNRWILSYSLADESATPENLRFWGYGQGLSASYSGFDSSAIYKDSAIDLVIPFSTVNSQKYIILTSKQLFDCESATNLFISFGLKMSTGSGIKRAGIFSESSGWYIEVVADGSGDNFRLVRRYVDDLGQTQELRFNRFSPYFSDRLDGSGSSGLVLKFDLVAMFAIELGSYDSSATKFYIYAKDASQGGSHRWICFAKIPSSDVDIVAERSATSLPITFQNISNGSTTEVLGKYGTSAIKLGVDTAPIKLFSMSSQSQVLIPEKEVLMFALFTKDLFNDKQCKIKQFPKFLNVSSTAPCETIIRRFLVTPNNINSLDFKPTLREEYSRNEVVYLVGVEKLIVASIELNSVVLEVNVNASAIGFKEDDNVLFVGQSNEGDILALDANTLQQSYRIITDNLNCGDLALVGSVLYASHPDDDKVTVWNVSQDSASLITTLPITDKPNALVAGDSRVFVVNEANDTVTVIGTSNNTVLETLSGLNQPKAIAYNRQRIYVSNVGDNSVKVFERTSTNYVLNTTLGFATGNYPDIIQYVDALDVAYVSNKLDRTITQRNYRTNRTSTLSLALETVDLLVNELLELIVFDSSNKVYNYSTDKLLVDLNAGGSFLKGNLLASGISAVISDSLEVMGEKIFSFISSGARQINLVNIFQEYREFFSSSFDSFDFNKGVVSQDLILFYVKNLGEIFSTLQEQIKWESGTGDSLLASYGNVEEYPDHIGNGEVVTANISVITGQN